MAQTVKTSAYTVGDLGSILGSGRSPAEGNGNPLQYSCLENPMDGGTWWATGSPWGRKELDMTERLYSLTHVSSALVILEQSFTTVALLIFWAGRFFIVGTVLWRTVSSIPDLSLLDASNTWPKMPRRQKET